MGRRYFSSTAQRTTLAGGIIAGDTVIAVGAVTGFPSTFPYTLVLDPDTASEEIVEVTGGSGVSLNVTRGIDGTAPVSHSAGAVVWHGLTARDLDEPNAHVNALGGVHGVSGDLVGTDDVQTLTNKTLDFNNNTLLNIPPGPTGATGPQGIAGVQIQNDPPADTSVLWIDPDDPDTTWSVGVPAGGTTGQYLRKSSDLDHVTGWDTITSADVDGLDTQLAGKSDTSHTHAYDPAGTASSAVAAHESDTTSVHGIADTSALVLTSDSRLSDARTPTAHAASHAAAGSDPITISESQVSGLTSSLAGKADLAATAVKIGYEWWSHGFRTAGNTSSVAQNALYLWPVLCPQAMTVSQVRIRVGTTTAPASTVWRLGVYADDEGQPGALIADLGTIDPTTAGIKAVTGLSMALPYGRIWVGYAMQGTASTGGQYYDGWPHPGIFPSAQGVPYTHVGQTGVSGALPSTWSGGGTIGTQSPMAFGFLRSA